MNWLNYALGVRKTPAITRSVDLLNQYFDGLSSEVTSGLRTPTDQLTIILKKMATHGLDNDFPEVKNCLGSGIDYIVHIDDINRDLFWWQRVWSKLLSIGDIVNPPVPAEVMFDYFRPGSSSNKKGEIIQISPHMHGLAFDIGAEANLLDRAKRVMKAYESGECFIKSFLCERINNAVHVDVQQIG